MEIIKNIKYIKELDKDKVYLITVKTNSYSSPEDQYAFMKSVRDTFDKAGIQVIVTGEDMFSIREA